MPIQNSPRVSYRLQRAGLALATATGLIAAAVVPAHGAEPNSPLDAPLFYQLVIGEMELSGGQPGTAYEVILDAARRTNDPALYRRAADIALQGRAGEQALAATRAWRSALPESIDALRLQLQILSALNRVGDAAEPLRTLLRLTPDAERGGLIAGLPRFLQRGSDARQAAAVVEDAVKPYAQAASTRVPVMLARGRAALAAGDPDRALALARDAQAAEPAAPGASLLALELMPQRPDAERIVLDHLGRPGAEVAMRLAYVQALTQALRYADAAGQLEVVTKADPSLAPPRLSLGALYLELKRTREAEAALRRYVDLVQKPRTAAAPAVAAVVRPVQAEDADNDNDDDDTASPAAAAEQGLIQAWLLLAQTAEQRNDYKAAEAWLARIDDPQRAVEVQSRRASILARQGKVAEARELVRRVPERKPEDARAKLVAEAGVLRDVKRWGDAFDVLAGAAARFPDDADLLYEQAMMAEKTERLDDMERLLRRVIALKPDSAHAHNALGYSLADRSQRLPEAQALVKRALELQPGDPFITDSLGWVEYRLGNRDEAVRLLRQAYAARPDTEIGAHLGEVLWAAGERDEARRIWREVRTREPGNDVLRETLGRLKVDL